MLTYKSTRVAEVVIIEREANGDQRVARAMQMNNSPNQWRTQIEHPAGTRQCSNVYGNRGDVAVALAEYLNRTRASYLQEAQRGHRPERPMRDANVPLNDMGQPTEITDFRSRGR